MSAVPAQSPPLGKQKVLDAAQELFAEGSYGDIGVALILEKAGVQAPTLYHHFGDKEGLFTLWAEQAFAKIEGAVTRNSGGITTLDSLIRYSCSLLSNIEFDLHQILRDALRLQRPESKDRVLGAYMRAVYEPLATILVEAVATSEFRNDSVQQLADVFLGGLLALRNSSLPVETMDSQAAWWCQAFIRAFAKTS